MKGKGPYTTSSTRFEKAIKLACENWGIKLLHANLNVTVEETPERNGKPQKGVLIDIFKNGKFGPLSLSIFWVGDSDQKHVHEKEMMRG